MRTFHLIHVTWDAGRRDENKPATSYRSPMHR